MLVSNRLATFERWVTRLVDAVAKTWIITPNLLTRLESRRDNVWPVGLSWCTSLGRRFLCNGQITKTFIFLRIKNAEDLPLDEESD